MTDPENLVRELIARPSVNPSLARPGDPHAGEQRVGEFLAATARKAGLDVEFQNVLPGRSNLLAVLRPVGVVRQRILLAPHLDTVGVADEAQFTPVKRNGRLYGRGACDTKGSVAVMLTALSELAQRRPRPAHTEIIFAGLMDEEYNQAGSRALAASGFKADLAIVGEPTRLQIITAHKGDLWLKIETRGRAAHGSRPELGRNAIHLMARVVAALETDYARQLRRRRHPLLGRASVNVGTIAGGTAPNIVPDHCVITVDRRTLPGETDAGVKREIRAFLRGKKLAATLADTKVAPAPPVETDPQAPLVRQFLRAAQQTRPAGVDFFTDAGVLAAGGIPCVVFGPGDIAQAHTADEWVAVSQLTQGRARLLRFLQSLP